MKKFLTTLALLTVIATTVFAQSFDPENGTGNVMSLRSGPTATPTDRFAVRQNGLDAQAMVPRAQSALNPNSPASTGGGSLGYNEMLRSY
jgi:opacity protein-like surface antigen